MIGLEYLCSLSNMSYSELADKLNISKATVSNWIAGRRNINEKYYLDLTYIFNVPDEWFSKELSETDKLKLQKLYFENKLAEKQFEIEPDNLVDKKMMMDFYIYKKEILNNIDSFLKTNFNEYIENNNRISDGTLEGYMDLLIFKQLLDLLQKNNLNKTTIGGVLTEMFNANDKYLQSTNDKNKMMLRLMIEVLDDEWNEHVKNLKKNK
ncbi:helix-turn-helix domain-containing protein [Clostridium perfringens]|nr:helix-turn-helix transcriptional regulator [Clostridium perfringens]